MKLMVITGANGQIGSYLAHQYHALGYALALLYHRRKERLEDLERAERCLCLPIDLQDFAATQQALESVAEHFGTHPGYLIHCAALRSYDALALADTQACVFFEVLDANLKSAYNILRTVLPMMRGKNFGRIVLLGSDITRTGLQNGSAYAAAKSGVIGMLKSVAQEEKDHGIRINAISPAPVDTVLEEDYQGAYLNFRREYFARYLASAPGRKLVGMDEIYNATELLIAAGAETPSGQELFLPMQDEMLYA